MRDVLELLARDDKWYLGTGEATIFAPQFPQWLDAPGFWDGAQVYQYELAPLFTVAALDQRGHELPLRPTRRRWTPAELTVEYQVGDVATATETRTVQPGGIFVSEWRVRAVRPTRLHLVAFTAQDAPSIDLGSVTWDGAVAFERTLRDRAGVPMRVRAELTCAGGAASWAAYLSERSAPHPRWGFTPFAERWVAEALPREIVVGGINQEGLLYAAVHYPLALGTEHGAAAFALRVGPAAGELRRWAGAPPSQARPSPTEAAPPLSSGRHLPALGRASRRRWHEFLAGVPHFRCSDPYLETYYWYRWYGLRLHSVEGGVGNCRHPSVCEGVAFFHEPIAYSAPCHARELRWLPDPEQARGVIRTFFDHQKDDGGLHGRVYVNHLQGTDFYHANWGDAVLAVDAVHPDNGFAAELYPKLARYADWLVRTRDPDASGMFDVIDQYETGQEYMSRYQAVDADADRYGWENRIRLKGVDVTVYAYALFRALDRLAGRTGAPDGGRWCGLAERTARAVREDMWEPATGMFADVDPWTGRRTGAKAAVCFYPYLTDLATAEHAAALERTLLDPAQFWTPYPVPSSSVDDPLFDAFGHWKGKRHVCPWNGRVWPMANSHVAEALANAALTHAPRLREATAGFISRFVRMMFHDGDLQRPNCYEHYNPLTGQASTYRGVDDYQHSWVNDLLIQYVAGVRPHAGGITVDPFPVGLEHAELSNLRVRGVPLTVRVDGGRFTVTAGRTRHEGAVGTPIEVEG